jgi:hypothetical protein
MPQNAFRIEFNALEFCLNNLKGTTKFEDFIAFDSAPTQTMPITLIAKIESFNIIDPSSDLRDLIKLSRIHQTIESETQDLSEDEATKLGLRYWLATLFHNYLSRYDLFREGFGCRQAWAHLLKIRYHTMVDLYRLKEQQFTPGERREFLRAFRDWRNFCMDEQFHFLFTQKKRQEVQKGEATELNLLEAEVKAIIYGLKCSRETSKKEPIAFFFLDEDGRKLLDHLIARWFLHDRYDWVTAVKLVWLRAKRGLGEEWVGILGFIALSCMWIGFVEKDYSWYILGFFYIPAILWCFCGLLWRPVMDLLLPRFWIAALAGYLPLFITDDVWKLAASPNWVGSKLLGMILLNLGSIFIAFYYMRRWEVGKNLDRTPNFEARVLIWRSAFLAVFGWLVAVGLGIAIFQVAGEPMADVVLDPTRKSCLFSVSTFAGKVYPTLLFQFAPFALLVGVILQIFWEDKPITEPL